MATFEEAKELIRLGEETWEGHKQHVIDTLSRWVNRRRRTGTPKIRFLNAHNDCMHACVRLREFMDVLQLALEQHHELVGELTLSMQRFSNAADNLAGYQTNRREFRPHPDMPETELLCIESGYVHIINTMKKIHTALGSELLVLNHDWEMCSVKFDWIMDNSETLMRHLEVAVDSMQEECPHIHPGGTLSHFLSGKVTV